MPYPNEHTFRISDPKNYSQFARKNIAPGVDIIIGIPKDRTRGSETQAYRFSKEQYTMTQALKWMEKHRIKYIEAEEAIEKGKNEK